MVDITPLIMICFVSYTSLSSSVANRSYILFPYLHYAMLFIQAPARAEYNKKGILHEAKQRFL